MLLSMSRGLVAGVLGATFALGAGTGWLLRRPQSDGPALSAPAEAPAPPSRSVDIPQGPGAPRNPARPVAVVKAVPTPGHFFRLGRQDTLSEVAKKAYGTTKRLGDLTAANPGLEPTKLTPGTLVYVPVGRETASSAPVEPGGGRAGAPIFAPK